jgi:hypothetical protein
MVDSCVGGRMAVAVGGGVFAGGRGTVTVGGGSVVLGGVPHAAKKNITTMVNKQHRFTASSHENSSCEYGSWI